MMKKRVPENHDTRNKSLGAISPYRVTKRREKKEPVAEEGREDEEEEKKAEVEVEEALPLKGIFCQSPLTGACCGRGEGGGWEERREGEWVCLHVPPMQISARCHGYSNLSSEGFSCPEILQSLNIPLLLPLPPTPSLLLLPALPRRLGLRRRPRFWSQPSALVEVGLSALAAAAGVASFCESCPAWWWWVTVPSEARGVKWK